MAKFGDTGHAACFLSWLSESEQCLGDLSEFPTAHLIELYPEIYNYGPHYHTWIRVIRNLRLKFNAPGYPRLILEMSELISDFDEVYSNEDVLSESGLSQFDLHRERGYRFPRFGAGLGYAPEYHELFNDADARAHWEELYIASLDDPAIKFSAYAWALDIYSTMHLFQDVMNGITLYQPMHGRLMAFQTKWGLLEPALTQPV
jgi:hypothetical protein